MIRVTTPSTPSSGVPIPPQDPLPTSAAPGEAARPRFWPALPRMQRSAAAANDLLIEGVDEHLGDTERRLRTALLGERALRLGSTSRDRLWAWLGPLLVTVLAAVARLPHLGRPGTLVFDETYYVKHGYTLLMAGFDADWPDEPNPGFESGNMDSYLDEPAYVVHPPVGKWMIAAGMRLGGPENPFSWRLATALVGILAVFLIARGARRLFSSTLAGTLVGGLFAIDGAAIVHARTGLLDNFLMFWVVVAFVLILADRDHSRRRLARRAAGLLDAGKDLGRFGPAMGLRWYRYGAAVALGLAIGTKWSGLYFLAVYAVITVLWDATARRRVGVTGWPLGALVKDAIPAALTMLPIAAVTYVASWTGWFLNDKSYKRTWALDHPTEGVQWLPPALRSLWEYHLQMWDFHNGLTSPHTYQANPLGWLLQLRPTSFYYKSQEMGQLIPTGGSCEWEKCSQVVTSLGNPVLWWLATAALLFVLWRVFVRFDWRGVAVLSGLAAGWLPWLAYAHRTIFTFYTIAFAPFMYLALGYTFVVAWEWAQGRHGRRRIVMWTSIGVGGLILLTSAFFYPIWTAMNVPTEFWRSHMWLQSWV